MDGIIGVDPLDEASADLLVAERLQNNTTNGIENGTFSDPDTLTDTNRGGERPKMNLVRHANNDPYVPPMYSAQSHFDQLEAHIRDSLPFKGRYGTRIVDRRLMIPEAYHSLLEFGGVITYGTDEQLLLFGRVHWHRMEQLLIKNLGLKADHDRVVRHFYRAKMEFDCLNEDGSITLSRSLMQFAGLKDKAVLIGVVYFAEIHNPDKFENDRLDGREIAKLSNALN